jgi:hypothetical protein
MMRRIEFFGERFSAVRRRLIVISGSRQDPNCPVSELQDRLAWRFTAAFNRVRPSVERAPLIDWAFDC